MLAFRARYVFPIDRPPILDGVVAIDHDRIVVVTESSSPVGRDLLSAARDLGHVAILPGLINAHTHLDFSDLRQPLGTPGMVFTQWIRDVVRSRRQRPADVDAIAQGIVESSAYGVTTLGDIASTPWQRNRSWPLEITEFCEVINFRCDADPQRYQTAVAAVTNTNEESAPRIRWSDVFRPGISPHAPYTVRSDIVQKCVEISAKQKIPLAHHLAESREELELLQKGIGPFVPLLESLGAWEPEAIPRGSRPLNYLRMLSKAHQALVIHGNYLDDEEIAFLAEHAERMSVVYCPRTHAYFQHDPYPLTKMLSAGVKIALGTDSRASNPDLSILTEMRFAATKHPVVPLATLLRMITADAAKALGREAEIGTLTPGKFADLAMVSLPQQDAVDPHELLLDSTCGVAATVFRGRAVHGEAALIAPGH